MNLAKAIELAARAHVAQRDKQNGEPYVMHPLRLMNKMKSDEAKIAAVLHDVVEDTPVTEDDLRSMGFAENVIAAVLNLSRRQDETYADFILRAKRDPIAREVKLADIEDNSNLPRALLRNDRVESDLRRMNKYILSYKFLQDELEESVYREWMRRIGE
jgi:(p)ppGpp synthase/HD superfamily hydrolase